MKGVWVGGGELGVWEGVWVCWGRPGAGGRLGWEESGCEGEGGRLGAGEVGVDLWVGGREPG